MRLRHLVHILIVAVSIVLLSGCSIFASGTGPRDVAGVYVPVPGSIHRFDTVFLSALTGPDEKGYFIHRFRDSSGTLHSDTGNFNREESWSEGGAKLNIDELYDLDFYKWLETNPSGYAETIIWKGYDGRLRLSVGIVMSSGQPAGGTYKKIRSLE